MKPSRYKEIVAEFSEKIRNGIFTPGMKLPTHRDLAKMRKMSLVTASRVYAELEAMGLVVGETGRGTFVREISLPPGLGIDQPAVSEAIDLNFNYPALPTQTELLRQALKQLASAGNLETLLRYQPHNGRLHERVFIAKYLQDKNITTSPENIVMTSGAQHGLTIAAMTLLKPGDLVAVDDVTYPGFKILADLYHFELISIPTTQAGLDLRKLEDLCNHRKIKAIYTMPTMHNPLGYVMSLDDRLTLVTLAKRYHFWMIEDAVYQFLLEDSPPALVTLYPEKTLYISSFSKSIAPGLRVGFILSPLTQIPTIERIIRCTTWNTPAMLTHIICQWLETGIVTQIEKEKRQDAQYRQSLAQKILGDSTTLKIVSHPSSYFVWIPLPEEVRAEAVAKMLLDKGISVSTAAPFATSHIVPHAIRLALGSVEISILENALEMVKSAINYHIDC